MDLKSNTSWRHLLLGGACVLFAFPAQGIIEKPDAQQARIAKLVAYAIPQMHLSREPFGDKVAESAFDIFVRSLDSDRVYFLASDIEKFRAKAEEMDDRLKKGDLSLAFEMFGVFMDRVNNRIAYAEKLLSEGFDFTVHETYAWKRRHAEFAADEAAWDELWRKKIKNEYIARVVSERLDQETAEKKSDEVKEPAVETAEAAPAFPKLTPEESILRTYRQFRTVLQDNDEDWLVERYLTSFAQAYDPHSDYLSPHNAEDFEISMKLSLFGIGALLTTEDGAAKVERLIPGGPAERDGRLKAGDKIIAVAQDDKEPVDIRHWPLYKTVRLIRGEKNTKVVLTVLPASDLSGSKESRIDIIRDEVRIEEQAAKGEIREIPQPDGSTLKMGVIRLPEFYLDVKAQRSGGEDARSASGDVRKILDDMASKGVQGVVLDLRNNGGGYLSEAVELTGLFLESGPVVQVKDQRRTQVLPDPDPAVAYGGPLVVLVNRLSASASEILAGALQDYGRAIVVGDSKTHGKGSVQTMTDLVSGNPRYGSLKVTTASFYRISGGSTQLRGVTPDIVLPSLLESMDVGEEHLDHAMPWSRIDEAFYDHPAPVTDVVPDLKNKSHSRRAADTRYQTYNELVDRAARRQNTAEISLHLEERIALARSDRELQKMIETMEPDEFESAADVETRKKDDVILDESLSILGDLIQISSPREAVTHTESQPWQDGKQGPL